MPQVGKKKYPYTKAGKKKAKMLPEQATQQQQQGLLQQQNPQAQQQIARMGQRPGGNMPMPNSRQAAQQGLLK